MKTKDLGCTTDFSNSFKQNVKTHLSLSFCQYAVGLCTRSCDCVKDLVIMSKDLTLMPLFFQVELNKSGQPCIALTKERRFK